MAKDDPYDRSKRPRRKRFAPPIDDGKTLETTPRRLAVYKWLDEMGPSPTTYIHLGTKHVAHDRTGLSKDLLKMATRHKNPQGKLLVHRPEQQQETSDVLYGPDLVHDLTPAGRQELRDNGARLHPKRFDPMKHRFMTSCIVGSVRLSCPQNGLEFITLNEILDHDACPLATRNSERSLSVVTNFGEMIPDALSGIRYKDGDVRFQAWEFDRASEQHEEIIHKFRGYLDMLATRKHEDHWGISSLYPTFVTTSRNRMLNIMADLESLTRYNTDVRQYFLFKYKTEFAGRWVTPPVLYDVLPDPWERADLTPFFLTNPQAH